MYKLCKACGAEYKYGGECPTCAPIRREKKKQQFKRWDKARSDKEKKDRKFYKTKAWQSIRKQILAAEPFCRTCGAPAVDVDHIDRNRQNLLRSNLQPLCKSCHARKTSEECNGRTKHKISHE